MEQLLKLRYLSVLLLSSCSLFQQFEDTYEQRFEAANVATISELQSKELVNVIKPIVKPVVAVYPSAFTDQTGQRKSNSEFALFSTALTQQPSALLIRALKHASNGEFFVVVERVGLDNLTKERQLIRSAREQFEKDEEKKTLRPLLFAGVLVEGAVIAYESNLSTGGTGARYLGIGSSIQYREDSVTVSLRMVSVATGEILIEVMTEKTIFSYGKSEDVFRFIEMGTELIEIELGNSRNESSTIALMKAIESAVLELINVGYDRSFWKHEEIKINEPDCDAECLSNIRG
jgi:curli production assembly/transport component CsgG|tara:strand:- start:619 stop:1488 length:870 start_codon:yes stop_codon:yes gene_type:complete